MSSERLKTFAAVLCAIPLTILAVLTASELIGGDLTGAEHILQIAPLLVLSAAAWRWPRGGGIILATAAVAFALFYPVQIRLPGRMVVLTEFLLFLPVILAGVLYAVAGSRRIERG